MAVRTESHAAAQSRQQVLKRLATAASALFIASTTLAVEGGCTPSPAAKTEADLATMKSEQTPDKLVERGRAFAALGDPTRAEDYLSAALDAGADPRVVMPLILEVCVTNSRYRSAIQHAENHLRKHPGDVGTRLVLGSLYVAVGEVQGGRAALEQVVARKPDEAQAHYALAVLARDHDNDPREADKHFREYLRIRPAGEHAEEARASLLVRIP